MQAVGTDNDREVRDRIDRVEGSARAAIEEVGRARAPKAGGMVSR